LNSEIDPIRFAPTEFHVCNLRVVVGVARNAGRLAIVLMGFRLSNVARSQQKDRMPAPSSARLSCLPRKDLLNALSTLDFVFFTKGICWMPWRTTPPKEKFPFATLSSGMPYRAKPVK
jgi:hypothetical protein